MPTIKQLTQRMEDALDATRREFATVRTGKASPALLDTVRVEAYGTKMPVNQVASVSTPDASLLVVQPFDKTLMEAVEKAIMTADLGLNPANDGTVIRVPIPALNEERRKEYARLLHKLAEEGRVSMRHARREGNEEVKRRLKEHELGEDEGRGLLDDIQRITDEHIAKLDGLLETKEKEVMAI